MSPGLAAHIASLSRKIGRQVGVLLSRDGAVRKVVVGDARQLEIPEIGRLRGGPSRFRGLRLVHTHLADEDLSADDLNDLALLRLDLVAMIAVDNEGHPGRVEVAQILPLGQETRSDQPFRRIHAPDVHRLDFDFDAEMRALEAEFARTTSRGAGTDRERVLVLLLDPEREQREEMMELIRSADVEPAEVLLQKRRRLHPRTVVGSGKLREIVLEGMRQRADAVIFDVDLKPAQARGFEDATGLKAVDRTQLILDIFAQRARSRDGKLQVELAQLKYALPRLTAKDAGLSRLAGGIGGRGPGETVLEIGRRRVRGRIRELEKQIDRLSRGRDLRRRRRVRGRVAVVSLVGYTNAGKSTLLNALTKSRIEAADRLFMTLDPTSRRLRFPRWGDLVLSDTVGFIRQLPPDLLSAFRATLEEVGDSDVLVHVADVSDERFEAKMKVVDRILRSLDLADLPQLLVLNKADRLDPSVLSEMCRRHQAVAVSALRKQGLGDLLDRLGEMLATGDSDAPCGDSLGSAFPVGSSR